MALPGKDNHMWKGDDVGYKALHWWVRKKIKKPDKCVRCERNKSHDLANKGVYSRDLDQWEWLCRVILMLATHHSTLLFTITHSLSSGFDGMVLGGVVAHSTCSSTISALSKLAKLEPMKIKPDAMNSQNQVIRSTPGVYFPCADGGS